MARKPRKIPSTTLKAVAAAHALGFTHWGRAQGTIDWAVGDDGLAHVVRRRTTGGSPQAAHICRTYREALTMQMRSKWPLSRAYTNLELTLCNPAWVCGCDGDFVDCPDIDGILEVAGLTTTVEVGA